MNRNPGTILTALLALIVACGCSSSSTPAASGEDSGGSLCSSDPALAAFGSGLSTAGTHGYTFELIEAVPSKPSQAVSGGNSWTIKVTNTADGGAADGLTLTATCSMKMPGGAIPHGCSGGLPPVTPMGNGLYKVSPIIFNMPGHWDLQFKIQNGATLIDSASIGTCIDQ